MENGGHYVNYEMINPRRTDNHYQSSPNLQTISCNEDYSSGIAHQRPSPKPSPKPRERVLDTRESRPYLVHQPAVESLLPDEPSHLHSSRCNHEALSLGNRSPNISPCISPRHTHQAPPPLPPKSYGGQPVEGLDSGGGGGVSEVKYSRPDSSVLSNPELGVHAIHRDTNGPKSLGMNLPAADYHLFDSIHGANSGTLLQTKSNLTCSMDSSGASPSVSPRLGRSLVTREHRLRMDSLQSQPSLPLEYLDIAINKSSQLGFGSYGAVYRAKCDLLPCAAKILHKAISGPPTAGGPNSPLEKFKTEIGLLSSIRHPNIVQYLTSIVEEGTGYPVLLMELCDESLTKYLERYVPEYHEQINICVDVSVALAHLHLNGFCHRDLTSSNVLLHRGVAKITDFGMSKLIELAPSTLCPGNAVYMSPEALDDPPTYTDKLDVFSFGVLMVQIMTQKFPAPKNRTYKPRPDAKAEVLSEYERRRDHIDMIEASHPLKRTALHCLADEQGRRPTSKALSKSLTQMKTQPRFTQSLNCLRRSKTEWHENYQDRVKELEQHNHSLQEKLQKAETENHGLQEKLQQAETQLDNLSSHRDNLDHMQQRLLETKRMYEKEREKCDQKEKEVNKLRAAENDQQELLAYFQKSIEEHKSENMTLLDQLRKIRSELKQSRMEVEEKDNLIVEQKEEILKLEKRVKEGGGGGGGGGGAFGGAWEGGVEYGEEVVVVSKSEATSSVNISSLHWQKGENAPADLFAGSAITLGENLYVTSGDSKTVYRYDSQGKWSELAKCQWAGFSLATISGNLVTVGGIEGEVIKKIHKYDFRAETWNDRVYPEMLYARREPVTLSTAESLVVAGGYDGLLGMDKIEVLTVASKTWSSCHPLPNPVYAGTMTLCNNTIYLAPKHVDNAPAKKTILSCPINELSNKNKRFMKKYTGYWENVKDLPAVHCSIVTYGGHLLAVGGRSATNTTSKKVWELVPGSKGWREIGAMEISRWNPIVGVLPKNRLVVIGGYENWSKQIRLVEEGRL